VAGCLGEVPFSRTLGRGCQSPRSCRLADTSQLGRKPKPTFGVTTDYANMFNHECS